MSVSGIAIDSAVSSYQRKEICHRRGAPTLYAWRFCEICRQLSRACPAQEFAARNAAPSARSKSASSAQALKRRIAIIIVNPMKASKRGKFRNAYDDGVGSSFPARRSQIM